MHLLNIFSLCFKSVLSSSGAEVRSESLPGGGPIFMEGLLCEGSEERLLECSM